MVERASSLAHAAGRPIGIVAGNPQMLGRFMSYGYDWGAVASDLGNDERADSGVDGFNQGAGSRFRRAATSPAY
jgi:hypothetical protein